MNSEDIELSSGETCVYDVLMGQEIVYVGIADNPQSRWVARPAPFASTFQALQRAIMSTDSEERYQEYKRVRAEAKRDLPVDGVDAKGDGFDAYYYGFEPTGVAEIDAILKAVASAGCISHNTDGWNEEGYVNRAGSGGVISPVDCIQEYANRAAQSFTQLTTKEPK